MMFRLRPVKVSYDRICHHGREAATNRQSWVSLRQVGFLRFLFGLVSALCHLSNHSSASDQSVSTFSSRANLLAMLLSSSIYFVRKP